MTDMIKNVDAIVRKPKLERIKLDENTDIRVFKSKFHHYNYDEAERLFVGQDEYRMVVMNGQAYINAFAYTDEYDDGTIYVSLDRDTERTLWFEAFNWAEDEYELARIETKGLSREKIRRAIERLLSGHDEYHYDVFLTFPQTLLDFTSEEVLDILLAEPSDEMYDLNYAYTF